MPPKKKQTNNPIRKVQKDNIDEIPKKDAKKKQTGGKKQDSDESEDDYLESDSDESIDDNFDGDNNEEEEENEDDKESEDHDSDDEDDNGDVDEENDGDDDCLYKFSGNKKGKLGEDDELELDGDDVYFEEDEKLIQNVFVTDDKRVTKATLTKYERVRILGERSKQLSLGAKPMVKNVQGMGSKEVAELELQYGVIPIIVIRTLPTGQKERWKVSELKIVN